MSIGTDRRHVVRPRLLVAIAAAIAFSSSAWAEVPDPAVATWSAWSPWQGAGVRGVGRLAVQRDATGRLQVFARVAASPLVQAHDTLWRVRQSGKANPAWQAWTPLGGPGGVLGDPVVGRNADGRLEVFCRGADGEVKHIWQTDPALDQWSSWESLGSGSARLNAIGNPTVGSNFDGRLDVFVTAGTPATGYSLHHIWQVSSPTAPFWTWQQAKWEDLGGRLAVGSPVVGTNGDGRLEVFARGAANELEHISQVAVGLPDGKRIDRGWSSWEALGSGGLAGDPAVGVNADGRLEVFVHGAGDALWHIWQTSASILVAGAINSVVGWSPWESLGGTSVAGDPVVGADLDGRLEVFVRVAGPAGASLSVRRQTRSRTLISSWWSDWQNLQAPASVDPAVGTNGDGRLEAFAFGVDHGVYHLWQQPAIQWVLGSTEQRQMGRPGNRAPDNDDRIPDGDLGQSLVHNGKIYFFLDDGTADFADPIGAMTPSGGASEGAQGVDLSPDREASNDFSALKFNYRVPGDPFSSLYRLNTPLGPKILGQDQGAGGGFSYGGRVYVFAGVRFLPPPPNDIPSPYVDGDERDKCSAGHSILTSAADPWGPYDVVFAMGPWGAVKTGRFGQVAPVMVKNAEIPLLPKTDAVDGVLMVSQGAEFGEPPGIFASWMPLHPGRAPSPSEMRFYKGNDHPLPNDPPDKAWSVNPWEAKRLFDTRYYWSSISMGRIRSSGKWILLYQKTLPDFANEPGFANEPAGAHPEKRHDGIYARIGTTPWNWSPEVKIFDPDRDHAWGKFIDEVDGFPYGAALINPYTNWDAAAHTVTIHYLLSTLHRYGVVLMRSKIQINN
jgi:hypothetical protein